MLSLSRSSVSFQEIIMSDFLIISSWRARDIYLSCLLERERGSRVVMVEVDLSRRALVRIPR